MLGDEFNNKKIIPQPADKDTRSYAAFERIIARLPSLEGKAGKILKVDAGEESCSWVAGGSGGTVAFEDILGYPSDNTLLAAELNKRVEKISGSATIKVGVDTETGAPYFEVTT